VNVVRRLDFSVDTGTSAAGEQTASNEDPLAWKGLPVICDEVFTGLYRLGRFSSSTFIGVQPDIAVHAKLLTGGLVPLCLTVASNHIFNAFLSDDKSDALLHGHSYTAHAVGCEVALKSLRTMQDMEIEGNWNEFKTDWQEQPLGANKLFGENVTSRTSPDPNSAAGEEKESVTKGEARNAISGPASEHQHKPSARNAARDGGLYPLTTDEPWSMWTASFLKELSGKENVQGAFGLGSVLAIALKDPSGSGESPRFRPCHSADFNAHSL
jgi:bifunctional dethiobiotin synthetase / adenosylmethionine---8-amino-7-oxononanoate aminotransferase